MNIAHLRSLAYFLSVNLPVNITLLSATYLLK